MNNMKGGTLFSGGGGFCLGMKAAGVEHAWGIEYDDNIAQVARDNGLNTITADILQCDPSDFEPVEFLHASPPCPNFSNAKANAEETENDAALAAKVCEFIVEHMPRIFTLENVYGYRKSKSWQAIARALLDHGYQFNYWHVNMADYGVPQTRKRMIVIARRDGITPMLPPATHSENPVNGLFERKAQWVGWYEAIVDLIPTLPDSEFAPWQLERLPDELKDLYLSKDKGEYSNGHAKKGSPAVTVTANDFGRRRAYIAPIQGEASNGFDGNEPAQTVAANHGAGKYRAFIAPGGNANSFSIREGNEPSRVVGDVDRVGNMPRAFVVNSAFPGSNGKKHYEEANPHFTIDTTTKNRSVAYTNGRVVKMTVQALARFQSFPDSYQWPDSNSLATRIIGNAVPPLFAQRLVEWLL